MSLFRGGTKKMLYKAGKEIMLKTVAQSLPNYAMSVFLLPTELCQEIEGLMCKFWWSTSSKKDRCIHWKNGITWPKRSQRVEWAFDVLEILILLS